jgi:hypothetical protein
MGAVEPTTTGRYPNRPGIESGLIRPAFRHPVLINHVDAGRTSHWRGYTEHRSTFSSRNPPKNIADEYGSNQFLA